VPLPEPLPVPLPEPLPVPVRPGLPPPFLHLLFQARSSDT
jgi:hypothetical protein